MSASASDHPEFPKLLGVSGALPLLTRPDAFYTASTLMPSAARGPGAHATTSIYERMLGVRPVINAAGPITSLAGTLMPKRVTEAMAEAGRRGASIEGTPRPPRPSFPAQ